MNPLNIKGKCAKEDEELFRNMDYAMTLGLPELERAPDGYRLTGDLIVAASGPSLAWQLDRIRELHDSGIRILAVRGAHDFLIENGIIPDYALTVDPLPDSWKCFSRKHPLVNYLIAAQCPKEVFDHLSDCNVTLWYPLITGTRIYPLNKDVIMGGTTSGLRALTVAYVMGYRDFLLFGYDSCLSGSALRVDGSGIKPEENVREIRIDEDGEAFLCNGAMAHQAQQFEKQYDAMPDATFKSFGRGLITAIIEKRERLALELEAIERQEENGRVSFIHSGTEAMASYRYRALIPSSELGWSINDPAASTLIFSKPQQHEVLMMAMARRRGQRVIVDLCDDHFDWPYYEEALKQAHAVVCPTETMAARIKELGHKATVIPDPYEYALKEPHCRTMDGKPQDRLQRLLWFGHQTNRPSLQRMMETDMQEYRIRQMPFHVVSNFEGALPWSEELMLEEFEWADIVLLPATEAYKSANRAVEAIRQGCFVVAEPHPAWNDIPGIWVGNIKDGIEWTGMHCTEANLRTSTAQSYVAENYSPRTVASAWKRLVESVTTSAAASANGRDGSVSILETMQT